MDEQLNPAKREGGLGKGEQGNLEGDSPLGVGRTKRGDHRRFIAPKFVVFPRDLNKVYKSSIRGDSRISKILDGYLKRPN